MSSFFKKVKTKFINSNFHSIIFKGYKPILTKNDFEVYAPGMTKKRICAAWNKVVVCRSPFKQNVLFLFPNYRNRFIKYRISLTRKLFPNLIKGSNIQQCHIIPHIRKCSKGVFSYSWRLVVITDLGQVFHNFPSRSDLYDGDFDLGDIKAFEESAIWDLPGKRFPSFDPNCDETERFCPYLPRESCQYHPNINIRSKYGNSGFDKKTIVKTKDGETYVSRFYMPLRTVESNPFVYMGGFEPDYKMTVLGTYRSNYDVGARIVVFVTSDGGRNWFAKFEFADDGETKHYDGSFKKNFGNPINAFCFREPCQGDIFVTARKINRDVSNKDLFVLSPKVKVKRLINCCPLKIETYDVHNLETGNIVFISGIPNQKEWMCCFNNEMSSVSNGNGILFKVNVVDESIIELYECVSIPNHNISCRHIHHINRIKDGWIIGTGETYPNGWLLYMRLPFTETYTDFNASDWMDIILLNHSENSVQRTIGADLIDDENQTFVFASDTDELDGHKINCNNCDGVFRNSLGVFKGKISEIDSFASFECILETTEPAYFFKKLDNCYVFSGQRGDFAVGFNGGSLWKKARLDKHLTQLKGRTDNWFAIDDYIVLLK